MEKINGEHAKKLKDSAKIDVETLLPQYKNDYVQIGFSIKMPKEYMRRLTRTSIERALREVNEGKVKLSSENVKFRLSDFVPMKGANDFYERNWHNYWCIPELRRELDIKNKILSVGYPALLGMIGAAFTWYNGLNKILYDYLIGG